MKDTPEKAASAPTDNEKARSTSSANADQFSLELAFPDTASLFSSSLVGQASDKKVLVAFDTNALLLPYSIGKDDLSALATVYRTLAEQGRLYVPGRCVREFIKNRDRKLADMITGLNDKSSRIGSPEPKLSPLLEGVEGYADLAAAAQAMEGIRKSYLKAHAELIERIKAWRGNDPVTALYSEVFPAARVIEHNGDDKEVSSAWDQRLRSATPPGYKDASKDDTGIGDFLIWLALLRLGAEQQRDLVFVTGEEKADWFVRASKEPIYPRPELVDEYRRASKGHNLRLSTLHELLREMAAPESVVIEIRAAEDRANTAIQMAAATPERDQKIAPKVASFDYSTNDGLIVIGTGENMFALRFSKASDHSIHFYTSRSVRRIARLKDVAPGERVNLDDFDTTSRTYLLNTGEAFAAENSSGYVLTGRILEISDDSRGAETDKVTFCYRRFVPGGLVRVP